jgi:hypothetical protein
VVEGGHGEWFVQPFDNDASESGVLASLRPDDAVAALIAPVVAGNRATAFVALQGSGTAFPFDCDARAFVNAPMIALTAPSPVYGRAPDARPNLPAAH